MPGRRRPASAGSLLTLSGFSGLRRSNVWGLCFFFRIERHYRLSGEIELKRLRLLSRAAPQVASRRRGRAFPCGPSLGRGGIQPTRYGVRR
jgi:hypothetical protein